MEKLIQRAAKDISEAKKVVSLTGAGISVERLYRLQARESLSKAAFRRFGERAEYGKELILNMPVSRNSCKTPKMSGMC